MLSACGGDGNPDGDAGADGGPDLGPEAGAVVFDASRIHDIRIEVDPADIEALEIDHENRVPCTFTFDGTTLHDVAIRQKGQGSSAGSLFTKPSFSVKFDEIVAGQELDGLDKLVFNNAIYDPTLLHEPLGYELYRRAGIPSPRAAHAVITFVGLPEGEKVFGVHVMVEAVNEGFLRRHYGEENGHGNLYEDEARGDFATNPLGVDLKDELEENRTREHLVELARILTDAPPERLVEELSPPRSRRRDDGSRGRLAHRKLGRLLVRHAQLLPVRQPPGWAFRAAPPRSGPPVRRVVRQRPRSALAARPAHHGGAGAPGARPASARPGPR